jgi:hypothetical protein
MVTMIVMVMMAVAANILVRLRHDRRSYHGRDKCRGAEEFQFSHQSLPKLQYRTVIGKAGSSGNWPPISPIPFKSAYHQFRHSVISLKP